MNGQFVGMGVGNCCGIFRSTSLSPVRFELLTASSMKMAVSWDVAPCSLIETGRSFRGAHCLHHQGDDRRDDGISKHLSLNLRAVATNELHVSQ
jgi:hypothetical protein